MLVDEPEIPLTPGFHGVDCQGNGEHKDENGNPIDCCCDECDDFLACFPEYEKRNQNNLTEFDSQNWP